MSFKEQILKFIKNYLLGFRQIILLNVNSGAMWAIDTKGFSYKNTRLMYIPVTDTTW